MATCDAPGCAKEGSKRCSRCRVLFYCSPECQKAHWRLGHKYECPISKDYQLKGLANQDFALRKYPEADYVIFCPNHGGSQTIMFPNIFPKACFKLLRSRAPDNPYCVWRMYCMIKLCASSDTQLITMVYKQLQAEYYIDPREAKDFPDDAEISEEDIITIQESLNLGQEERRLLLAQAPPSAALRKQNEMLMEHPEVQYFIFDPHGPAIPMSTTEKRGKECFKLIRKRAAISPRCLNLVYKYIYIVIIQAQPDIEYMERIVEAQLESEYGRPVDKEWEENDPCNDVAQYVGATMTMSSPED